MEPRSIAATHGKCMTNSSSNSPVRKTTGHGSGIEQNDRQRTTSERLLPDGGREHPAPGTAVEPNGEDLTCSRCGDHASRVFEGAENLNLCEDCHDDLADWLSNDGRLPIEDQLVNLSDEFREHGGAAEARMYGDYGFHTVFDPDRSQFGIGESTALHIAFEKATRELYYDSDRIRHDYGEITPETVAETTAEQIDQLLGPDFAGRFVRKLEETLEDADAQYGAFDDPDEPDRGEGIETDGGVAVSEETDGGPDPTVTWHGLNAFQRDCLRAVATLGEPKGLAVKERLETFYGEDVNHGRLYPNLDHLVDEGLVRKGTKDKRTNSYAVTEWGQTVLDARDDLLQGGVDR